MRNCTEEEFHITCFDINEKTPTPTPTPDCKGKITYQSLRYDGVWINIEKEYRGFV